MKPWTRWERDEIAQVRSLHARGFGRHRIARALGVTEGSIAGLSRRLGLHPAGGRAPLVLPPDHPAMREQRSRYPSRTFDGDPRPLKSGDNSAKIGAVVTKGDWRGMPIWCLTLEERATCPQTCPLLACCYGNGMPWAKRMRHGPGLETALRLQLVEIADCSPIGFVVRLHILGDFYSADYVDFWRGALDDYPHLHVWGYTGWLPDTEIGRAIQAVRKLWPERFRIRFSGARTGFRTKVIDHEREAGSAIICPVETGASKNCGACSLCWASDKPVAFLRH